MMVRGENGSPVTCPASNEPYDIPGFCVRNISRGGGRWAGRARQWALLSTCYTTLPTDGQTRQTSNIARIYAGADRPFLVGSFAPLIGYCSWPVDRPTWLYSVGEP